MEKLSIDKYPSIVPLIKSISCGQVYPLSVAEGTGSGDIYTSEGSFLIWHQSGFAYVCGGPGEAFLDQVCQQFLSPRCDLPRRFILFTADPRVEAYFRDRPGIVLGRRCNFCYPEERVPSVPDAGPGYQLRTLDPELINELPGRITPRFSWSSPEEFHKNGMGFCLLHGDEPVSWAFSAAVSSEETDIGIETVPDHQHMGLGLITAGRMIQFCLEHHKRPVWACDAGNLASRRLAEKLGFVKDFEYTTVRLR